MEDNDIKPTDSIDEIEAIDAELVETVEALRALPKEATPPRDLWPGIQSRIREASTASAPLSLVDRIDSAERAESVHEESGSSDGTSGAWWNRTVSAPWAMAASVVFASLIGFATWQAAQRDTPENTVAEATQATAGESAVRTVATSPAADLDFPEYDLAVTGLQQAYEAGKGNLAPETVEVLEQSLAAIDEAIAEARAAIEADPARDEVRNILLNNLNRKLDVLRQAAEAVQTQA